MKSVAQRLSAAALMVALMAPAVGVQAAAASTSASASTSTSASASTAADSEWVFYAAFATAGACFAQAAAYRNEYWWVIDTTCILNAAQNTWLMFYET